MNVMQRSSKQDCIKMALIKIRPCRNARINPEPSSSGDRTLVAIDCHDGISVLQQTSGQFAPSTTDLQNLPAI